MSHISPSYKEFSAVVLRVQLLILIHKCTQVLLLLIYVREQAQPSEKVFGLEDFSRGRSDRSVLSISMSCSDIKMFIIQ